MGVSRGRDHSDRLVQQVVDEVGADADRCPVDLDHIVVGVDASAEDRHLAVDRHPPGGDQVLGDPTAAVAGGGQHLLEPLALRELGASLRHLFPQRRFGFAVVHGVSASEVGASGAARLGSRAGGWGIVRRHLDQRGDTQAGLQRFDDICARDELGDRREVVERRQAQLLEERCGRPEQDRLARALIASDLVDVPAGLQRAQHTVGVDAADRCDLRTGDRLLVGHDRKRFERSARQPGSLIVEQETFDVGREIVGGLIAPSAGDVDQLEAVPGGEVGLGEFLAPLLDHHRRLFEQLRQEFGGHRVVSDQHDRLDRPFELGDGVGRVGEVVGHRQPS